jgi:hypothetical protein
MKEDGMTEQRDDETGGTPVGQKLRGLLTVLLARTVDGSLAWEPDDGHEDSYCAVGPGWVVATRTLDGDGMAPYALVVAGPAGEPVLQITSTSPFGRPLASLLAQVHVAAAGATAMSGATPLVTSIIEALAPGGEAVESHSTSRRAADNVTA